MITAGIRNGNHLCAAGLSTMSWSSGMTFVVSALNEPLAKLISQDLISAREAVLKLKAVEIAGRNQNRLPLGVVLQGQRCCGALG